MSKVQIITNSSTYIRSIGMDLLTQNTDPQNESSEEL